MSWLLLILLSRFLLALVSVVDRYLLRDDAIRPVQYAFYVGVLAAVSFLLIPFVSFQLIPVVDILIAFVGGGAFVFALVVLFWGIARYEVSRVVAGIGGLLPIATFLLSLALFGGSAIPSALKLFAFVLLITGSVLILYHPERRFTGKSVGIAALAAVFFSLYFVLSKHMYDQYMFWNAFLWLRIGEVATAGLLLSKPSLRHRVFGGGAIPPLKTSAVLAGNQVVGAIAFVLENVAIAIAPVAALPILNGVQGVRYVFLFLFTLFFSAWFPQVVKEELTPRVVGYKTVAIGCIVIGIVFAAL